jgi:hypothetical protein
MTLIIQRYQRQGLHWNRSTDLSVWEVSHAKLRVEEPCDAQSLQGNEVGASSRDEGSEGGRSRDEGGGRDLSSRERRFGGLDDLPSMRVSLPFLAPQVKRETHLGRDSRDSRNSRDGRSNRGRKAKAIVSHQPEYLLVDESRLT